MYDWTSQQTYLAVLDAICLSHTIFGKSQQHIILTHTVARRDMAKPSIFMLFGGCSLAEPSNSLDAGFCHGTK